ncbi:uncharacterized protein B0T23DRAFT_325307 [Neurospora hispaniola]|uniref:Vegetative incompatibility protein HET-E-1 n=1 Tax=Neurospora hispaniola TaxID=588809 RepID=A0AAJ0MMW9_9PEZI|nr:hypothetical protein B0T23DRAFT_325307 [Neurospora hispaniola]
MFRWYRNSSLCLALLSDVDKSDFVSNAELQRRVPSSCRWFTRGWTLQELLAPDNLVFFDVNWKELGRRSTWAYYIFKATGIHPKFLSGIKRNSFKSWDLEAVLRDTSVATKMSWAAGRQTTRVEDQAYCLLGLFDIHMPMLYGEGKKAFARLQQEIMKSTDDCTLLAWGYNEPLLGAPVSEIPFLCRCCRCDQHKSNERQNIISSSFESRTPLPPYRHLPSCAYAGVTTDSQDGVLVEAQPLKYLSGHNAGGRPRPLFATSPQDFRLAGGLEPCGIPGHKRPAFSMSQRGLEISLPIVKDESHQHIVYGLLACSPKVKTEESYLVTVPLIRSSVIDAASAGHDDEYVQSPFCLPCKVPVSFSAKAERMSICIRDQDRYRRLWDSVGYLERPLIFDFGHSLATKKEGSTLRLELMYPSQPLCSMYFTLLRNSCPYNSKSCAPSYMWPGGASLNSPGWWSYHLARPPPGSCVLPDVGHPWDKNIQKKVQYAPDTTIAAAVLNFDPFSLNPIRPYQTRILLVVSFEFSCRLKKLGPDEVVTLQTLMTVATKPELAGPKLEFKRREVEDHGGWKEGRHVYEMPDGIELCLRTWF